MIHVAKLIIARLLALLHSNSSFWENNSAFSWVRFLNRLPAVI
jgi:hypothetical protein